MAGVYLSFASRLWGVIFLSTILLKEIGVIELGYCIYILVLVIISNICFVWDIKAILELVLTCCDKCASLFFIRDSFPINSNFLINWLLEFVLVAEFVLTASDFTFQHKSEGSLFSW